MRCLQLFQKAPPSSSNHQTFPSSGLSKLRSTDFGRNAWRRENTISSKLDDPGLFKHGMTCRRVSLSKLSSGVRSQQMTVLQTSNSASDISVHLDIRHLAWQSQHLSTQIQRSQVPLMSLLQRIKWLVVTATPFTWTVKEQYIYIYTLMCFDAFVICLFSLSECLFRLLPVSESDFQC